MNFASTDGYLPLIYLGQNFPYNKKKQDWAHEKGRGLSIYSDLLM